MDPSDDGKFLLPGSATSKHQVAYLANFVENAFDAIVSFDYRWQIISWNPAAEQLFGWNASEVLGKTSAELFWPVNTPQEQEEQRQRQSQLESGKTLEGEFRPCRKDGSIFWAEYTTRGIFDEDSGFSRYVGVYRDITERKLAVGQLQYQTALLSNVNDAIIASDAHFRITAWNSSAESLYGWKAEEVIGCNGLEIVRTEWPEKDAIDMRRTIAKIGRWRGEATQVRKDGSRFPVEVSSMVLHDDHGQITGYISVNRDITERKQAEEALRKSEERYRTLFVSMIEGFALDEIILDADGKACDLRYLVVNPAFEVQTGLKAEDIIGRTTLELFPEAEPIWFERYGQVVKTGEPVHFEERFGPLERWFEVTAFRVDEYRLATVFTDITERKKADDKLRASEESFRSLANAVPSIVWAAAPDGTILYTNEFWYKYTGANPEVVSSNWAQFLHPDDIQRSASEWARAVAAVPNEYILETRIRRYDGQYRWFQTRAIPVRDSKGNVIAWYGVTMDIHDRIEAVHALHDSQQQLQFLNEALEQKVNEQTAEMRKLTSNLTKAEQRERHRIAHILHEDLQQRLYAVKMQLAFLLDGVEVEPEIGRKLSEADKQLNEILGLTRHLSVELSPPILHDEGLTQALEWLASQMHEKHGLQIEIRAEESFAVPDEDVQVLLFSCVRELLFNTVKHAGVNQAVVVLKRMNSDLRIEVHDDGKGFDAAALAQSHTIKNNEEEPRQWSFGLPTLRHQLGLFGGQMGIQSEPGAGTHIIITIPLS